MLTPSNRTTLQQLNDHHFDLLVNHERIEWLGVLLGQINTIVKDLPQSTGKHAACFYTLQKLADMAEFMADSNLEDLRREAQQLEQQIKALEASQ